MCGVLSHSCPTLCNPMDYSPPGSFVHGILQSRTLERVAMPSSRGSSWPRDQTYICYISSIGRWVLYKGFPRGSAGKEATYNAGVLGSIPRLGRSPGEGKGYAIQYYGLENSMDCIIHGVAKSQRWLSDFGLPLAQLVKKPPAMWETWVWSLGWEDPLEKGKATQSSILAWRVPWTV